MPTEFAARGIGAGDLPRSGQRGFHIAASGTDSAHVPGDIRSVQDIKEFRAEFQLPTLPQKSQRRILDQREIHCSPPPER